MANLHIRNVDFQVRILMGAPCSLSSVVERHLGKMEVIGSFPIGSSITECSSAWPERLLWEQNVGGSNPSTPTIFGPIAQSVRAGDS